MSSSASLASIAGWSITAFAASCAEGSLNLIQLNRNGHPSQFRDGAFDPVDHRRVACEVAKVGMYPQPDFTFGQSTAVAIGVRAAGNVGAYTAWVLLAMRIAAGDLH